MGSDPIVDVRQATTAADIAVAAQLFRGYADSLPIDLGFQGFDAELASLPGKYAPPAGRLYVAWRSGKPLGCIALRPLAGSADRGEIKRLYVLAAARGLGLGRRLAQQVIADAAAIGYRALVLDTLGTMTAALALYRSLGFRDIPAYYDNPVPGTVYLELGSDPIYSRNK
ncbi:MAG: GNAT family N-acetyltransferase [Proteobacteria bacterium]|nr:GNAT family N-acetyltransferase [Pseudomonadota bacterium]